MPPMERSHLHDKAVLWERASAGYDEYADPQLKRPVEIDCRWVENYRVVKSATGNTIALVAKVVVARRVKNHSVMWKGRLCDLPSGSSIPDLVEVQAYNETSDVKGREYRRDVDVSRYSGTLPTVTG